MNTVTKPEKIHIRIVPFGRTEIPLEIDEGTTVEGALALVNKTYSPATIRVGGKSAQPATPLRDGQVITTDLPRIVVGRAFNDALAAWPAVSPQKRVALANLMARTGYTQEDLVAIRRLAAITPRGKMRCRLDSVANLVCAKYFEIFED